MASLTAVETIFQAALEKGSPEERAAYLDQACQGDSDLRRQVERLLHAQHQMGSFLEQGAAAQGATSDHVAPGQWIDPAALPPPSEGPGTRIGPYKLLQQIGEGGMGVVFLAEQEQPVRRKVALKIIRPGMDSTQVIARFEAERQALALMDHANIARVLDGGTTSAGRPYFVMDLVNGMPITRYCDEHHLTPRQRLELFIPVCQAVQHAHQKGIIHRDLKPSNVLVALYDGKPVPKVIDFGVAKATGQSLTDKTLVTGFGAIVGTLEYMSPEQAEVNQLDIDTRSDIYALGVLLYELLTGSPPFSRKELEKAGMLEMLRVIREQEPSKPSTKLSTAEGLPTLAANRGTEPAKLAKLVRGELDWIVMKALEKDRNRRYETANGFAMDVQRYLAGEPVLAAPASQWYRLRKFARKNRGGLAVAALVLFFLVLLGSGVGWAVRDRSAREAEAARQQGERQAKVAGAVESIFGEVGRLEKEQKWPEALEAARRAGAAVAGGEADPATAERVHRRLKDLEFIDRLEQIRMEAATPAGGNYFNNAGADRDYAGAFRAYGVDIDELPAETSIDRLKARPEFAIALAAALDDWVYVRRSVPKADVGRWKRLVDVASGIDPDPLRDRLRATWGQYAASVREELRRLADSIDVRVQHPATLIILARVLNLRPKDKDAAVRILQQAQQLHPGDFWLNFELGYLLLVNKDFEGSIRFYTAAVAIRPGSFSARHRLVGALLAAGRVEEAIAESKKLIEQTPTWLDGYYFLNAALQRKGSVDAAIAEWKKIVERDPKNAHGHSWLGLALQRKGDLEGAYAEFRKATELDPKDGRARSNLALALLGKGRVDEAIAESKKLIEPAPQALLGYQTLDLALQRKGDADAAIAEWKKIVERDPKSARGHTWLGLALERKGDLEGAYSEFRKAIEHEPKSYLGYDNLLRALQRYGRGDEAIAEWKKVIELNPEDSLAHHILGHALQRNGRVDEAIAEWKKVIELKPTLMDVRNYLGLALRKKGRVDEAIAEYRKAIERNPDYANTYVNLADALRAKGQLDEAITTLHKAIELDPKDAKVRYNLGNALRAQGKLDEAVAAFREMLRLKPDYAQTLNDLAWGLATAAERKNRDGRQAVALAQLAVEAAPANGAIWNTLGAARYSAGNWKEAIAALEKSMDLRNGGDSVGWFFLAMAHWQRGDKALARKWYAPAVLWMDKNAPGNAELRRFRDEAAALLSLTQNAPQPSSEDRDVEIWRLVLEARPESVAALYRRGEAYAARSEWAKAAADYAQAAERQPDADSHFWFEHACLRLLAGDAASHAKVCAALLQRGEQKKDVRPFLVARACTLAPLAASDIERAARLAAGELKDPTGYWSLTEAAALEVRAGRYDRAEMLLRRCLNDNPNWDGTILARLWLALALHGQGKGDEARKELAPALVQLDRWGKQMPARKMPGRITLHLHDWLETQVLRHEAELIKKNPQAKNPESKKQAK